MAFSVMHVRFEYGEGSSSASDVPRCGVPDSHTGVKAAGCYPVAIKCNGIDLAVVALKCMETSPFGNAPDPSCRVVATRNNNVSLDFEATNTSLMPHKDVPAKPCPDVPHPQSGISRSRYSRVRIRHFQATNCGGVAT